MSTYEDGLPQEVRVDFDFAVLALKGGRFNEAEQRYSALIQRTNSPAAWSGLGLAKISRLYEGRGTVDEVMYCFQKARTFGDSLLARDVELLFAQTALGVVADFYEAHFRASAAARAARNKVFLGAGITALAVVVGSRSGANLFTQLGSASVAAYGIGHARDASRETKTIPLAQMQIWQIILDLRSAIYNFGSREDPDYANCIHGLEEVEDRVRSLTAPQTRAVAQRPATPWQPSPDVAAVLNVLGPWGYFYIGQWQKVIALVVLVAATKGLAWFILWPIMPFDSYLQAKMRLTGRKIGQWTFFKMSQSPSSTTDSQTPRLPAQNASPALGAGESSQSSESA